MSRQKHIKNQREHAKKRFEERFKITLNKKLRKQIISRINNNKLIKINTNKKSINYYIVINNIEIIIVFHKKTKNIVTCLYYRKYMEEKFEKITMGIKRRIRKKFEEIANIKLSNKAKEDIEKLMSKEFKKVREFHEKELEIKKKSINYINTRNHIE